MFYGILCEKIEDNLKIAFSVEKKKTKKSQTHTHTCVPCTRALYLKKNLKNI